MSDNSDERFERTDMELVEVQNQVEIEIEKLIRTAKQDEHAVRIALLELEKALHDKPKI